MATATPQKRPKPMSVCTGCNRPGNRWHCDSPANRQCDWVVCDRCQRIYQRSKPARWTPMPKKSA